MDLPFFGTTHHRQRRLFPAIMATSGVPGLLLGYPIQNAACKALFCFSLCRDNSGLKNVVRNLLQRQNSSEKTLLPVQEANDENFFLGTEIADTQKIVEALRDVIDACLSARGEAVREFKSQLNKMKNCKSIQSQFELIADRAHIYTSYLDLDFMLLKSCRASFVSSKTFMRCAAFSLSSEFVPPCFLTPNQLAAFVEHLTMEEILRGTKLTPAIKVGSRALYYGIRIVLEVTVLREGLPLPNGIPINSKSSTFNIHCDVPLYQSNEDGTTASVNHFSHEFTAIATDNLQ